MYTSLIAHSYYYFTFSFINYYQLFETVKIIWTCYPLNYLYSIMNTYTYENDAFSFPSWLWSFHVRAGYRPILHPVRDTNEVPNDVNHFKWLSPDTFALHRKWLALINISWSIINIVSSTNMWKLFNHCSVVSSQRGIADKQKLFLG
jgi:hypothetical protein